MRLAVRAAVLLAIVGALLFWLARDHGPASSEIRAEGATAESPARAPEQVHLEAPLTAPSEEPARAAVSDEAAPAETHPAAAPVLTLLLVHVVARETKSPLANVHVGAYPSSASGWSSTGAEGSHAKWGESASTDAEGRAELEVPPGEELKLLVSYELSKTSDVPALAQGEQREIEVEFTTQDDLIVYGRLVDDESREGLGEGVVWLEQRGSFGESTATREEIRVRPDGTFRVQGRSGSATFYSASSRGYARAVFALEEGFTTPDRPLEIRLKRAATLEISVLEGPLPVGGARTALSTDAYQLQQANPSRHFYYTGEDPTWSATTDANGLAELGELPPGVPLVLRVWSGGPRREEGQPLIFEPGERRQLVIRIGAGATIAGRIEDSAGVPIAGCEIWRVAAELPMAEMLKSYEEPAATARSGPDGRFRFEDVAHGAWLIGPRPSRGELQGNDADSQAIPALGQPVKVDGTASTIELTLRVDRGLFLSGTVVDARGQPIGGVGVMARAEQGIVFFHDNADDGGRWRLGPMPAGRYLVSARPYDGAFAPSEEVPAAAGQSEITLRLRAGGALRGRIVDAAGQPREASLIVARSGEDWGWMGSGAATDGTFSSEGLLPATYTVSARTADGLCGRSAPIVLGEGQTVDGLEIVCIPGARLRIRYEGEAEYGSFEVRADGVSCAGDGVQRGTAHEFGVPAGEIEVRLYRGRNDFEARKVTLAVGEERELVWKGKP